MPTSLAARLPARRWPWWLQVLAVYGVTRLVSTAVFLFAARGQPVSYWAAGQPDYATFVAQFWDGAWYRLIAEYGYPAELPLDVDGSVSQNAWAFFPLYPALVRAVMLVSGAPWQVAAPALSLALGAGAMLLLDRLIQRHQDSRGERGRRVALGSVLLVGLFPAAAAMQAAYTESLALFLVLLCLWLLGSRRYLTAIPVVVALGFTRAVALPMLVVVLGHLWLRWRRARADGRRLPRADVLRVGALAAAAGVAGLAWPAVVALATGEPDAYVATQSAWRGSFSSAPLVPWFQMAGHLIGDAGMLVLLLTVLVVVGAAASRPAGAAGPEARIWGVAYVGYLLLVAFPQSSIVRFLLLAFTIPVAAAALARSRWQLCLLAAVSAAGQLAWVLWVWQLTESTGWPP